VKFKPVVTRLSSYTLNRFQKIDRLSNRRLWIARAVKGGLCAWRPTFQKDSTSTADVSRRKRHVCAGLRRLAAGRSTKFTQTFYGCHFRLGRGQGGPIGANAKITNRQKSKFQNKTDKTKIAKTFFQFCFHEVDLEIVHRKFVFLFFEISGETLASSSPCAPFAMARCIFNASKQCPYEATTFYLAEQPR
jgi:hypothetical protein